jgi:hypothetical protein
MLTPALAETSAREEIRTRVVRGVGLFSALFILVFVALAIAFGDTGEIGDDPAGYLLEFSGGAGYRLFATLDALFFFTVALVIWSLANLARGAAPLRCQLATLCALGVTVGALGGFIRLDVYSRLAERFQETTAEQQPMIAEMAWLASSLADTAYMLSQLFGGLAFALVAWALAARGVAAWFVALSAAPGVTLFLLFVLNVVGMEGFFVVVLLTLFAVMTLGIAMGVRLPNVEIDIEDRARPG